MSCKQTVWRVRDWDVNFERSQGRRYPKHVWFAMPNRMDSNEQTAIMDHENGIAHFGTWVCLLQVASSSRPRGFLLRQKGMPHDVASLSRITRIPVPIIEEAIPRLIEVPCLEVLDLDAVETLVKESERAAKSSAPLPKKLARVLTRLGVPKGCPIAVRRQVMKSAAEFGGPAKFAARLEKAIEAGCIDLSSATAWVRKTGWSEADRMAKEAGGESERMEVY